MRKSCKQLQSCCSGFTLAEMMVVMLIMSIILAAMAPVMTTRSKADSSSPWRYSPDNLSDAYFGPGDSQIAMIGQPNKLETDDSAKLIINSSASLPVQLSFKRDNTTVGRLLMKDKNLLLGDGSFDKHTTGEYNIAIGDGNLTELTTGNSNIAIGDGALVNNTSGSSNVALGTSLNSNTIGEYNVALGDDCLKENVAGSSNVAVGYYSLKNSKGNANTAVGAKALETLNTGVTHVAVGYQALQAFQGSSAEDNGNTAVGSYSMLYNTTGVSNTALGYDSLRDITSGNYNVSLGYRSNYSDSRHSMNGSIAVGAGSQSFSDYAVAIGYNSKSTSPSSISLGVNSEASSESSIVIGDGAISTSDSSIALGKGAMVGLPNDSSFSDGIAIGTNAKIEGTSCEYGPCNYKAGIAIGRDAYSKSSDAVVMGNLSYAENDSIAIGYNAQAESHSVVIGSGAHADDHSVAIGANACKNVTGEHVTCIGYNSGPRSASDYSKNFMVYLGTSSDTVYIPGNLVVDGHVMLGTNSGSYIAMRTAHKGDHKNQSSKSKIGIARSEDWHGDDDNFGLYNAADLSSSGNEFFKDYLSDRRLKYVGKENSSGLDKIRKLKVFNYTFKRDKKKIPHVGVMAQDLQKVFPDAVKKGKDGFLTIRFEDMFFAMINAIKELDLKYQAQEKRINDLEARIQKLEAKIK